EAGDRPPKKPAARAFPPRREGTSSGRAARSSEACPEAREEAPRATRHKQLRRRRPRGAAAGETSPSDERSAVAHLNSIRRAARDWRRALWSAGRPRGQDGGPGPAHGEPAGSPEPHAGSAPERAGARPRRCEGPGRQQTSG
ncbi:unnamed protein product, partial [Prorocentrum cordatum]